MTAGSSSGGFAWMVTQSHGPGLAFAPTELRWLLLALFGIGQAEPLPLEQHEQGLVVDGETVIVRIARGLELELLTNRLRGPRLMTFGARDELLIGSKSGLIYRLTPPTPNRKRWTASAAIRTVSQCETPSCSSPAPMGCSPSVTIQRPARSQTRPDRSPSCLVAGDTAAAASPWVPMASCM